MAEAKMAFIEAAETIGRWFHMNTDSRDKFWAKAMSAGIMQRDFIERGLAERVEQIAEEIGVSAEGEWKSVIMAAPKSIDEWEATVERVAVFMVARDMERTTIVTWKNRIIGQPEKWLGDILGAVVNARLCALLRKHLDGSCGGKTVVSVCEEFDVDPDSAFFILGIHLAATNPKAVISAAGMAFKEKNRD